MLETECIDYTVTCLKATRVVTRQWCKFCLLLLLCTIYFKVLPKVKQIT